MSSEKMICSFRKISINVNSQNTIFLMELLACGIVWQIMSFLLLTQLTCLELGWIISGKVKILCMTLKHKFMKPEVAVCYN